MLSFLERWTEENSWNADFNTDVNPVESAEMVKNILGIKEHLDTDLKILYI